MQDDRIKSRKQFAEWSSDLQDSEAVEAFQIVVAIQQKYAFRTASVKNLDALRDELLTRLMEINILASVDVSPVLNGEPPVVEFIGKIDPVSNKEGLDHEQKSYQVKKAKARGEDYLGEKEPANSTPWKKRHKNESKKFRQG